MCNGGVNFMLDWDREGVYRFAALQSDAGRRLLQRCGRSPDDISSIVLVEAAGGSYTKASAVLRIAQRLRAHWYSQNQFGETWRWLTQKNPFYMTSERADGTGSGRHSGCTCWHHSAQPTPQQHLPNLQARCCPPVLLSACHPSPLSSQSASTAAWL